MARRFADVQQRAEEIRHRLLAVSDSCDSSLWYGIAADAFRLQCEDLLPDLEKLARSHDQAADALGAYAYELERAQNLARQALSTADHAVTDSRAAAEARAQAEGERVAAQGRADAARSALRDIDVEIAAAALVGDALRLSQLDVARQTQEHRRSLAVSAVARAVEQRSAAERQGMEAEARLEAARQLADDARAVREDAGLRASRRIDEASEAGIQNRPAIVRAFDAAIETIQSSAARAWQTFLDHLDDMATVLTLAGLVLVRIPIPGLMAAGGIMLAAGTALSAAHFVRTLDQARRGAASAGDVGWAALGLFRVRGVGRLGGMIKRSLAYADNRTLSGWARRVLWEPFDTSRKIGWPAKFFNVERAVFQSWTVAAVGSAGKFLFDATELVTRPLRPPGSSGESGW